MSDPPTKPIPIEQFKTMIPSSRANPPKLPAAREIRHYTITVRRRDRSGRWNQVASWIVTTDEDDMAGPLAMGLKPNYQILILEGKPPPATEESPPNDHHNH